MLYTYIPVGWFHVSGVTMRDMLLYFCRSLYRLHWGTFEPLGVCASTPTDMDVRLRGERICGPWCLDFAGLIGDLEFKRDVFHQIGSQQYYACNSCCAECFASKVIPELAFDDFRPTAAWTRTRISLEDYLNNTPAHRHHGMLELIGFRSELSHHDILHNLYCGPANDLHGSVAKILILQRFYGGAIMRMSWPYAITRCERLCVSRVILQMIWYMSPDLGPRKQKYIRCGRHAER
jgi:hypothetical protein